MALLAHLATVPNALAVAIALVLVAAFRWLTADERRTYDPLQRRRGGMR